MPFKRGDVIKWAKDKHTGKPITKVQIAVVTGPRKARMIVAERSALSDYIEFTPDSWCWAQDGGWVKIGEVGHAQEG